MNTARSFDVIILAGGKGSRLRPVVADRQKTIAEVAGRPFLCFLLRQLGSLNINQLIICTGYRHVGVKTALKDYSWPFRIEFSREQTPLGTGGALRQAMRLTTTSHLLVMNGDSFIDCDLETFCETGCVSNRPAQMLLTEVADASRFGQVELDEQNRVVAFAEKNRAGSGLINAGVYFFESSVIERIPANTPYSLEKQFFPELVAKRELYGYPCGGKFIDIGTPESYADAEKFFSSAAPDTKKRSGFCC